MGMQTFDLKNGTTVGCVSSSWLNRRVTVFWVLLYNPRCHLQPDCICFPSHQYQTLQNAGCILIPGAKRVTHFPDCDCSRKTAISSFRLHIFIRLFYLQHTAESDCTLSPKGTRVIYSNGKKGNSLEAVLFERITWAHAVWLGVWIIYRRFIYGLRLNKGVLLAN